MQPASQADSPKQHDPQAQPLEGQHALVTGGNRGIGAAIAEELGRLGVNLTLAARDRESLNRRRELLSQIGPSAIGLQVMDLTDPESIAQSHMAARDDLGPITILINNAGVAPSAPLGKLELKSWKETFAINVQAAFLLSQAVLPGMQD